MSEDQAIKVVEAGAKAGTDYFASMHEQLATLSHADLERWLTGFAISHMSHMSAAIGQEMAVSIAHATIELEMDHDGSSISSALTQPGESNV